MLTAEDCADGTPQCSPNDEGKYLEGDDGGDLFTSCDLKCDVEKGRHVGLS